MDEIAKIVQGARRAKGWSGQQLAAAAGVSYGTLRRIERGEETTVSTLRALADALELSARERAICLGAS